MKISLLLVIILASSFLLISSPSIFAQQNSTSSTSKIQNSVSNQSSINQTYPSIPAQQADSQSANLQTNQSNQSGNQSQNGLSPLQKDIPTNSSLKNQKPLGLEPAKPPFPSQQINSTYKDKGPLELLGKAANKMFNGSK